jgi:hypothetical protein
MNKDTFQNGSVTTSSESSWFIISYIASNFSLARFLCFCNVESWHSTGFGVHTNVESWHSTCFGVHTNVESLNNSPIETCCAVFYKTVIKVNNNESHRMTSLWLKRLL